MLTINRDVITNAFVQYTEKYTTSDEIRRPGGTDTAEYPDAYHSSNEKIKLKIDHTYRVAGLCDTIAANLGLSKYEIELAWLLGMLHDIGRFEQVRRYGTFQDAKSVDHAKLGADLLFQEGLIADYLPTAKDDDLDLVELAIRSHNVYHLSEDLSERELLFCNILRDADKIDILKVNIDTPMEIIYDVTTEELKNSEVTPEVLTCFDKEQTILKSIRKNAVDSLVGHISLTFELVFPISLSIVAKQGYLEKMMDFRSDNEKTKQQFVYIRKKMHDYLETQLL